MTINVSFPTEKYRYTMWQQLNNQTEVAEKHSEYLNKVVNESYLIGYHRCQYVNDVNQQIIY